MCGFGRLSRENLEELAPALSGYARGEDGQVALSCFWFLRPRTPSLADVSFPRCHRFRLEEAGSAARAGAAWRVREAGEAGATGQERGGWRAEAGPGPGVCPLSECGCSAGGLGSGARGAAAEPRDSEPAVYPPHLISTSGTGAGRGPIASTGVEEARR